MLSFHSRIKEHQTRTDAKPSKHVHANTATSTELKRQLEVDRLARANSSLGMLGRCTEVFARVQSPRLRSARSLELVAAGAVAARARAGEPPAVAEGRKVKMQRMRTVAAPVIVGSSTKPALSWKPMNLSVSANPSHCNSLSNVAPFFHLRYFASFGFSTALARSSASCNCAAVGEFCSREPRTVNSV